MGMLRNKANVEIIQAAEAGLDTFRGQVIDQLGREGLMTGRFANVLKKAQPETYLGPSLALRSRWPRFL